jgi:hypothetical protein
MDVVEFLLANRRWDPTCLRANIAPADKIELFKKTKRVHVESNVARNDATDRLLVKALRAIAPEWWDDTRVILNRNVTCEKHRDGNEGHSWVLWLGDFSGGALVFDSGERFTERGVWHKINGRTPHWNEPHEGTKYGVVLYRRTGPSKNELIRLRKNPIKNPIKKPDVDTDRDQASGSPARHAGDPGGEEDT